MCVKMFNVGAVFLAQTRHKQTCGTSGHWTITVHMGKIYHTYSSSVTDCLHYWAICSNFWSSVCCLFQNLIILSGANRHMYWFLLILEMVRRVAACFWSSFHSPRTLTGWCTLPPTLGVVLLKISSIKGRFFSPLLPSAYSRPVSFFWLPSL